MGRPASKPAGLTKAPRKTHPVAPSSTKPEIREPRLSVDIPADLHQAVKVAVAQRGTSMRAATIEALEWWLKSQ